MADNNSTEKPDAADFLEALYGEPLRRETSRMGVALVTMGLVQIAVVLFGGRLTTTSIFPVNFGERADVLPMVLSLVVWLATIAFILRALTDFLRSKEARVLITRYLENERIEAATKDARAIDAQEPPPDDEGDPEPDAWWQHVYDASEAAERKIARLEETLGMRRFPRVLRSIRLCGEIGVPLAIGLYASLISVRQLLAFGATVIGR